MNLCTVKDRTKIKDGLDTIAALTSAYVNQEDIKCIKVEGQRERKKDPFMIMAESPGVSEASC